MVSAGVTVGAEGQNVDIVLFQPRGGRSQAEGDTLLTLVTQGSPQAAIFRSDDLDATFEKVRASGAEVLQEPRYILFELGPTEMRCNRCGDVMHQVYSTRKPLIALAITSC